MSDEAARVNLWVNGLPREVLSGTTLARLLEGLELHEQRVAVEVNARIVRRAEHPGHVLCEGDRIEIVTFVGGG